MKAVVFAAAESEPEIQDLPSPEVGSGEAKVRLTAAALNHRDLWIRKGLYAGISYPLVPGSDGVGEVIEASNEALVGKRVVINPSLEWGESEDFQSGDFKILGLPDQGTWAEEIVVPESQIHEAPAFLSDSEAAAIPLACLTAYRGLFSRGGLSQGDKVLITGIGGGVALFGLQMAVARGVDVVVTSTSAEKRAKALEMGARAAFDYLDEEWTAQLEKEIGLVDVVLDGVGGEGYPLLIDVASPGARIVNYGATAGTPKHLDLRKVFWKQLNLLGSTMGSPSDFQQMLDLVSEKEIRPVVDQVFPMAEASEALNHMDDSAQFGKIVLEI